MSLQFISFPKPISLPTCMFYIPSLVHVLSFVFAHGTFIHEYLNSGCERSRIQHQIINNTTSCVYKCSQQYPSFPISHQCLPLIRQRLTGDIFRNLCNTTSLRMGESSTFLLSTLSSSSLRSISEYTPKEFLMNLPYLWMYHMTSMIFFLKLFPLFAL